MRNFEWDEDPATDGNRGIVKDYFQIESSKGVSTPGALERVWQAGVANPIFCPGCGHQFRIFYEDFQYHADYDDLDDRYAICLHCGTSCQGTEPPGFVIKGGLTNHELAEVLGVQSPQHGPSERRREFGIGPDRARKEENLPRESQLFSRWFVETGGHRRGPPEDHNKPRKVYFTFVSDHRLARPGLEPPLRVVQNRGQGATTARVKKSDIKIVCGLLNCDGLTDRERGVLITLSKKIGG